MVFNPMEELGKGGSLGFVCDEEDISLVSVVPSTGKYQTPSEIVILFTFLTFTFDLPKAIQITSVAEPGIKSSAADLQACVTLSPALKLMDKSFSKCHKGEKGGGVLFFYFHIFFWGNKEELLEILVRRVCALHVGYSEMKLGRTSEFCTNTKSVALDLKHRCLL